jgi:opacity protein-like surface antigen
MSRAAIVMTALVALTSVSVQAQGRFGLELRVGAGFPTQDLGTASLNTGAGSEVVAMYRVMPHLQVYGGFDWYRFSTDTPFAGTHYDVENSGYAFGMQFRHPVVSSVSGWARAGGMYNHIELEDADEIVGDSDHTLGWEVGGGLHIPLTANLALTPGVRYRSLSTDVKVGAVSTPVDMSYIATEIGLSWTFGSPRTVTARAR